MSLNGNDGSGDARHHQEPRMAKVPAEMLKLDEMRDLSPSCRSEMKQQIVMMLQSIQAMYLLANGVRPTQVQAQVPMHAHPRSMPFTPAPVRMHSGGGLRGSQSHQGQGMSPQPHTVYQTPAPFRAHEFDRHAHGQQRTCADPYGGGPNSDLAQGQAHPRPAFAMNPMGLHAPGAPTRGNAAYSMFGNASIGEHDVSAHNRGLQGLPEESHSPSGSARDEDVASNTGQSEQQIVMQQFMQQQNEMLAALANSHKEQMASLTAQNHILREEAQQRSEHTEAATGIENWVFLVFKFQ
jgi:hypothetical protein